VGFTLSRSESKPTQSNETTKALLLSNEVPTHAIAAAFFGTRTNRRRRKNRGVGSGMKHLKPRDLVCRRLPALQDNRAAMEKSEAKKEPAPRAGRPRSRSWIPPLQLGLPVPSSDPFDEVSGVEFRRVFPNQVAPFEEFKTAMGQVVREKLAVRHRVRPRASGRSPNVARA